MKHYGFLVGAFAMLVAMTGFAMADPGVNATFETQGITIINSIQAQGNMDSMTDIDWVQTSADPPLEVPLTGRRNRTCIDLSGRHPV